MIIKLTLKHVPDFPVDARNLAPHHLKDLDPEQIALLPIGRNTRGKSNSGLSSDDVHSGGPRIQDLFSLECISETSPSASSSMSLPLGESAPSLILSGDLSGFHRIGQDMNAGCLWVEGNVGVEFASSMRGGVCVVTGKTGDYAAQSLRGGLVTLCGPCGHDLAAPLPGKKTGMTGGDILVGGSTGDRVAHRMRRGTILISGQAGNEGCQLMIAGTVVARGPIGHDWCIGMKRGSLIELNPNGSGPTTQAGLTPPREFELSFLQILWRHLRKQHSHLMDLANMLETSLPFATLPFPQSNWVTRQIGDTLNQGQGEWLRLLSPTNHS